jgi:hypothetical protein
VTRVAGNYLTDGAVPVVVKVDGTRFGDTDFAWTAPAAGSVHQGYGAIKPRKVCGVDPLTGKGRGEIVPDIGANVWTGVATTFTSLGVTYDITARRGELLHLTR